jgi:hypothetical protein
MNKKTYPKKNIASLVQHANNLVFISRHDRSELEKSGMQWSQVERLSTLLTECSIAEAQWRLTKENCILATKQHKLYLLECRKIRTRLASNIRVAIRILGVDMKIPSYKNSWSGAELVQDLNDLAVICRTNHSLFEKTRFDFDLAEHSAFKAKELAETIANVIVERETRLSTQLEYRNSVCNELYEGIKTICLFGRKAFVNNPLRRINYHTFK